METKDYLQELKDILTEFYKNGGIDSVNFITQGGSFYFETEEDFLEVLGHLESLL